MNLAGWSVTVVAIVPKVSTLWLLDTARRSRRKKKCEKGLPLAFNYQLSLGFLHRDSTRKQQNDKVRLKRELKQIVWFPEQYSLLSKWIARRLKMDTQLVGGLLMASIVNIVRSLSEEKKNPIFFGLPHQTPFRLPPNNNSNKSYN